jgi:hypothetical protein
MFVSRKVTAFMPISNSLCHNSLSLPGTRARVQETLRRGAQRAWRLSYKSVRTDCWAKSQCNSLLKWLAFSTNSIRMNPSCEAASCAATYEFPNILWNPKVYCRAYKSPPLVPILSQINTYHTTLPYFSKIDFNIILPTSSWSCFSCHTYEWKCPIWNPCIPCIPFVLSLGYLSKKAVQVRGPLWHFVTKRFLKWETVSLTPNQKAIGPPLIGCPRLLLYSEPSSVSWGCPLYLQLKEAQCRGDTGPT